MAIANVALTNTFDEWRTRTNQIKVLLESVAPTSNTVTANSVSSNTISAGTLNVNTALILSGTASFNQAVTFANTVTHTGSSFSIEGTASFTGANTNILGGTLLVTSNTNINGTLIVNGTDVNTISDDALAFAIALG